MQIQMIAIIAAVISSFILGALWYSPLLFGNTWQKEEGLNFEQIKSRGMNLYLSSLISSALSAYGFYYLVQHSTSLQNNLISALIIGILFIASSLATHYQFAGRSNTTFLIDSGYDIARFLLYALVFWFANSFHI